jgi:hypothetical protein
MAVAVETDGGFRHDTPVVLFAVETSETRDGYYNFDATPDGKRFLLMLPVDDAAGQHGTVTLVQNWRALLE